MTQQPRNTSTTQAALNGKPNSPAEGGDVSPSSLASSLTPQTPPVQVQETLSSDGVQTRVYHYAAHRGEPVKILRAEELEKRRQEAAAAAEAQSRHLKEEAAREIEASQADPTLVQKSNSRPSLTVKATVEEGNGESATIVADSAGNTTLPSTQSNQPIKNPDAPDSPSSTVIMAKNAVVINNDQRSNQSEETVEVDSKTDAHGNKETHTKVRRTKDGRTKPVGGGRPAAVARGSTTSSISQHTHPDVSPHPHRAHIAQSPTTGAMVYTPSASPQLPHDMAPPSAQSPAFGTAAYVQQYHNGTTRRQVPLNVHPASATPYSAHTLQPDRVVPPGYTPSSARSLRHTPNSSASNSSKVSFSMPLVTPSQVHPPTRYVQHPQHHMKHIVVGPDFPLGSHHSPLSSYSPSSKPQMLGDRLEPGLPSIYSRRGSLVSSYSGSTYSARTRSVVSRPKSAYSQAHTPVIKETKDLKNTNREVSFYSKKIEQVAAMLTVDPHKGLDDSEAQNRLAVFGENKLKKEKNVSTVRLFFAHLVTALNIILLIAGAGAIVSAVVEGSYGWIEGVVIVFIIVTNAFIGFSQEYRSAKTMESLMDMFAPEAEVTRGGERKTIAADQLVPGDIVHLEDGDFVPADLRIVEAVNMSIDESIITGESEPVSKVIEQIKPEEAEAIGDRKNMAYMSSVVSGGRGKGMVVRTGEDTELGQIAQKLRSSDNDKKPTHLQMALKKLGWVLLLAAVALSFIVLAIQVLAVGTEAFGERYTWLYIVALCVAIIPEGLPAVLALTLAVGMRQMARKNAIVRKLGVLESLNWITDICSDKTGTLTEGKMMATMIWTEENWFKVSGRGIIPEGQITERDGSVVTTESLEVNRTLTHLLQVCSLCNMATLTHENDEWTATSSPTEIALQVLATKAGMGKPSLIDHFRFLGEHPFDSNSKRMSVAYERSEDKLSIDHHNSGEPAPGDPSRTYLFMKGSLESVIKNCIYYKDEDGDEVELDDELIENIHAQAEAMAGHGLRVLAMAYKTDFTFDQKQDRNVNDADSTFLGLVGIMDPPRPQSKPAVDKAHAAGINVYMLTGDHKKTAASIAEQVSIIQNPITDHVMVGSQFEQQKVVGELPKVVARCNPNTKIKMIDDLHSRDRFVAMTGDGVNDAPAIKRSDVGIAMGQNGSEVTKDSADIVLLDDNFGTIIVAIEEGRRIFANISKLILHVLSNNFALVIILVFGLIYSFFVDDTVVFPLSPMQILWLNVITDTPVASALGMEPATPDIMAHPPRTKGEGLFNIEMTTDVLLYGVVVGALSLANFGITLFTADEDPTFTEEIYGEDVEVAMYRARAVCFVTLLYCMLYHVFNCVHPRNSVLMYRGKNIWIFITVIMGAILVIPTIYCPWVNVNVFLQYHLRWVEWIQVFAAVAFFAIISEIYKILKRCLIGGYRNGHYLIHLAERTTNALSDMNRIMQLEADRSDPDKRAENQIDISAMA